MAQLTHSTRRPVRERDESFIGVRRWLFIGSFGTLAHLIILPLETFLLASTKYKGFVFSIEDMPGNHLKIDSLHLVTREAFLEMSKQDWKKENEYSTPTKIKEEIISIVEYLTKKPVKIRTDAGPLLI